MSSPSAWPKQPARCCCHRFASGVPTTEARRARPSRAITLGITRVLSYQIADAERTGTLIRVLRSFESNATPVNLVHRGQPPLPLKLRAFLDFAAPRLRARLAEALDAGAH